MRQGREIVFSDHLESRILFLLVYLALLSNYSLHSCSFQSGLRIWGGAAI